MDTELVTDIVSSSSEKDSSRFLLVLAYALLLTNVLMLPLVSALNPDCERVTLLWTRSEVVHDC